MSAASQASVLRRRWVRIVGSLFPLSPSARAYVDAQGSLEGLETWRLHALRAMLSRERQYLRPGMRHGVQSIIESIDKELEVRS
jgi:hypothetical protein